MVIFDETSFNELIEKMYLSRLQPLMERLLTNRIGCTWNSKEICLLLSLQTNIFKQFWITFSTDDNFEIDALNFSSALVKHIDHLFRMLQETTWDFHEAMLVSF